MEEPRPAASDSPQLNLAWLPLGAVVVLLGMVIRSAWITEDAYITLRTVDNLMHGFGLRWNIDERVQGFTHPLWMALLSLLYLFTREDFFTTIFAGVLTTTAALLLLLRLARSPLHGLAAVLLLSLSLSFVEFSTSGLENPLTHLLIALFVLLYLVRDASLRWLWLAAALLALNRSDAVLVVLPALLYASFVSLRTRGARATLFDMALGLAPYLAWEVFSIFYYGFPFPNTAYAKLNTSLPAGEVKRQGLTYLFNGLAWDPPTLVVTGLGVAAACAQKRLRECLLALGALLYLLYVIRIGGDFMEGRFLTLPLFTAVCLIASARFRLDRPLVALALLAPFGLLFLQPSATERYPLDHYAHSGVADERAYYRDGLSLMMYTRQRSLPNHRLVDEGRAAMYSPERLRVHGNIGMFGFFAGPRIHIVDPIALTDPLLARLPVRYDPAWRVGHYIRVLPAGYLDTLRSGQCMMPDKSLCAFHDKLKEIVAGDLWSFSRLVAIAGMNFGAYDHLLNRDLYRFPELAHELRTNVSSFVAEGAVWNSPGARSFPTDGIALALERVSRPAQLLLSLDGNDAYEVELKLGARSVETLESPSRGVGAMSTRAFSLATSTQRDGFDTIVVRPTAGDGMYSVGYVRLIYK